MNSLILYFNPRSREGSDFWRDNLPHFRLNFNPRSREGSDAGRSGRAYGCTDDFNPRSREGSDHTKTCGLSFKVPFQSTLPRRERQSAVRCCVVTSIFQSTLPRRERRGLPGGRGCTGDISIHAPAKGATLSWRCTAGRSLQFQSTLPRRERHRSAWAVAACKNFNPRSREGSDKLQKQLRILTIHFNPRSREGSDVSY